LNVIIKFKSRYFRLLQSTLLLQVVITSMLEFNHTLYYIRCENTEQNYYEKILKTNIEDDSQNLKKNRINSNENVTILLDESRF